MSSKPRSRSQSNASLNKEGKESRKASIEHLPALPTKVGTGSTQWQPLKSETTTSNPALSRRASSLRNLVDLNDASDPPASSTPKLSSTPKQSAQSHQRAASTASGITIFGSEPLNFDAQAIKVVVRVRNTNSSGKQPNVSTRSVTPEYELDSEGHPATCMDLSGTNKIDIKDPKGERGSKPFFFDAVFAMETEQESVYGVAVEPLIRKCLDGYNGCIFAYGQTASGKTHTMQGPADRIAESLSDNATALHPEIGIISRVVHQLHEHVRENRGKLDEASGNCLDFVIKVSYLEIYNEGLVDLLVDKNKQEELKIRMESGTTTGKDLYVQNLSERYISSLKDYFKVLTTGAKNRSVGETNMNAQSSRSHAILTITIDQYLVQPRKPAGGSEANLSRQGSSSSLAPEISSLEDHSPEQLQKIGQGRKRSKIHLIDLAGSERADSTGATGDRLKEGAQINQSLSALGNVISALTSPTKGSSKQHIPYRDSKLTYLLSDSLGGNALTLMITCCSPTAKNYSESLSTLRFAERVKKVINKAVVNMDPYLLRIAELEAENLGLRKRLEACTCGSGAAMSANCDVHSPPTGSASASSPQKPYVELKDQEQQTEEPKVLIPKPEPPQDVLTQNPVTQPSKQCRDISTSPMTPETSVANIPSQASIGIQTDPWLVRAVYQLQDWGVI
ncbi:UNVERIFIED_CONTAM: hypothetical protein HDU68_008068 [Siphonaria sp. JEL0065]|nr:hypothetical protein HDU68_008068 [Siphonaria sp. JEL0065]